MTLFGKWLGWGMLLSCLIGVAQAQPLLYQEGQHYLRLPKPLQVSDSPQEVVEMFSYRCPHCFSFEPVVESWLQTKPEGVAFVRIPVGFGRASWELMARTYYAAQELGVAEQMDHPLFDAIHVQRKPLATPEEIAEVFAEQGISADDFLTAFKSNQKAFVIFFETLPTVRLVKYLDSILDAVSKSTNAPSTAVLIIACTAG